MYKISISVWCFSLKVFKTRMHSNRMRTAHFSGHFRWGLLPGGCLPRVGVGRGVFALGGVCLGRGTPHCMLGYTPPLVNGMTYRSKTLPCPQTLLAGGKHKHTIQLSQMKIKFIDSRESDRSLKLAVGLTWRSFLLSVSNCFCGNISVSYRIGCRSE